MTLDLCCRFGAPRGDFRQLLLTSKLREIIIVLFCLKAGKLVEEISSIMWPLVGYFKGPLGLWSCLDSRVIRGSLDALLLSPILLCPRAQPVLTELVPRQCKICRPRVIW